MSCARHIHDQNSWSPTPIKPGRRSSRPTESQAIFLVSPTWYSSSGFQDRKHADIRQLSHSCHSCQNTNPDRKRCQCAHEELQRPRGRSFIAANSNHPAKGKLSILLQQPVLPVASGARHIIFQSDRQAQIALPEPAFVTLDNPGAKTRSLTIRASKASRVRISKSREGFQMEHYH